MAALIATVQPRGFDPQHFDELAAVEDRHFWFTSRNRLLARMLAPIGATLPDRAMALEIGTGTGNTLRVLEQACPRATVIGTDLYGEGLWIARRRTRAHLVRADALRPPFARPFDLVAAFDVVEHVEDDAATLSALREVLAPNGWLILTVPACKHLWSRFDEAAHHCRRYERRELHDRLVNAGFEVERLTFFMAALYPIVRTVRGMGRRTASEAMGRELRIVPVVNGVLRRMLEMETRWIGAGRGLPIGTSLLAIARRT